MMTKGIMYSFSEKTILDDMLSNLEAYKAKTGKTANEIHINPMYGELRVMGIVCVMDKSILPGNAWIGNSSNSNLPTEKVN